VNQSKRTDSSNLTLILGGSGFLGRSLASALDGIGAYVGTSRTDSVESFTKFDTAEEGSLRGLLSRRNFSTVVNLIGSTSNPSRRGLSPRERMSLFSQFTDCEDLLISCTRIIHVGSGAEYGSAKPPFSEGSMPMNLSEYGDGKLEETNFFSGLANHGLEVLVLRPSIVFGASQKGDMLVPSVVRSLKEGREPNLREPMRVRDFLYEKDFASAVIRAMNTDWKSGQILNLGSGSPVRVQEFVAELSRMIGSRNDTNSGEHAPHHNFDLTPEMDTSLIRKELDWSPRFNYKSAIADLVKML